ncbi:hypothetical protein HPULCUR_004681 [Helicostylum pulchrum]|uniref:C3H1-type domain-containing protein n=1 Tax=Helicostylum pulchrum TaxID=562976 RepID=A0ABP9XX37_9FUNG
MLLVAPKNTSSLAKYDATPTKPVTADINPAPEATKKVVDIKSDTVESPKPARPFIAAYNAIAVGRQYVASSPNPAKPFLAVFNATKALTTLKAREYVNTLPKAPKPVLAAYNATTASITLKERGYINSLPKAPKLAPVDVNVARAVAYAAFKSHKPSLATFYATVASATSRKCVVPLSVARKLPADQNVARVVAYAVSKSVSESSKPSLTACNVTVASAAAQNDTAAEADTCVAAKTVDVTNKAVTSNLASEDAAQASQLSQYEQSCQQDKAGSNTTSSSSVHSGTNTFATIAAASVTASASNEQQSNSNFYGTTWDKLFDERITNNKPLSLNNTAVFSLNNAEKKEWSRKEKIRKQSQSHLPKMKNRCDYWPACTNKNCKFSHPTAPCRAGDECTFGKRCSFVHPKDLVGPPKKRSNSTGTPKRNSITGPPKRTASSGGNTRNNNRYSAISLKK